MDTTSIEWVSSGSRWLSAGGVLLAYAGLCALVRRRWLHRRQAPVAGGAPPAPAQGARPSAAVAAAISAATNDLAPWVVYASQSGQAEAWARHTERTLQLAQPDARAVPLDALTGHDLAQGRPLFFIASTTGEGDAPDNALAFERRFMAPEVPVPALPHLRYGLMALGDRDYSAYCGFGRRLDAWLRQTGAQPCFDRIEVNQADPAAWAHWLREVARVAHRAGVAEGAEGAEGAEEGAELAASAQAWAPVPSTLWRVSAQQGLNPGSAGQPLVQLSLRPADDGALPSWQAGDLVQIAPPDDAVDTSPAPARAGVRSRARDYSIANLPEDGELRLLVRRHVDADGRVGRVSGWLTSGCAATTAGGQTLQLGDTVRLRVRAHPGFRLNVGTEVPLILIGNGSGLAGLRAHLQQRVAALRASGQPAPQRSAWLLFGERSRAHDQLLAAELSAWQASGALTRLDTVFSRDTPEAPYVQDRLQREAERLRRWVAAGAHILVCGSLHGMGHGVNAALRAILGDDEVNALTRSGRIRRDVY